MSTSWRTPHGRFTEAFHKICTRAGVECTVTADPCDYGVIYQFKNFGDRLVRISHESEAIYLEPGEVGGLKVKSSRDVAPEVVALNNGTDVKFAGKRLY